MASSLAKVLVQSVEAGNMKGLRKALNSGADINGFFKFRDNDKAKRVYTYTPLQLAAHCGRLEAAEHMLDNGAQVDLINPHEETAFHVAVDVQDLEMVKLLHKRGADASRQNKNGYTPLHFAVLGNDRSLLLFLLDDCGLDANVPSIRDGTPFILAAREGKMAMLAILADKVNDVNETNRQGHTALYLAVEAGSPLLVETLLKRQAIVNQDPPDIRTCPLALAVSSWSENLEIFRLLHRGGGNLNKAYPHLGRTILHQAADHDRPEIVEYLLDQGVDLNQVDSHGNNALSVAVMSHKPSMVKLLCKKGITVHKKNKHNVSALDIARERKYHDIEAILDQCANGQQT